VVHGAGSFGHFMARQYALNAGGAPGASAADTARGFALTRQSVRRLNGLLTQAALEAGVPATGLSPCGSWACSRGQLAEAGGGLAAVRAVLGAGLVPVLHGDAVLDDTQGCCILSGDVILRALAEELRPGVAVFLTDVAGIYTKPPAQPGAQLVTEILVAGDASIVSATTAAGGRGGGGGGGGVAAAAADEGLAVQLGAAEGCDTTGGMAAKAAEACRIAARGCPVVIAAAGSAAAAAICSWDPQGDGLIEGCTVVRRCKPPG
jgi:isopentenyl phosphate kinase